MEYFDPSKNKIFFGNDDKLETWTEENIKQNNIVDKIRLMLKNYLELDNVSFLFGSGTSIHLGAVAIRNFPIEVETYIKEKDKDIPGIMEEFFSVIKQLQAQKLEFGKANLIKGTQIFEDEKKWKFEIEDDIIRDIESKEIAIEYEKVLNYLIALEYVLSENKSSKRTDKYSELITVIKEGLFTVCDVDKRRIPLSELKKIVKRNKKQAFKNALKNKYYFHEMFLKALLQRPLNLRRANVFCANYDLAFEYAFDKLGIHYIDGFAGFHKRFFKPETFEYDIFYPGSTTSGKFRELKK